jgi:hypothetical protein
MAPTSAIRKHRPLAGHGIELVVSKIMLSQAGYFGIGAKV